MPHIAARASMPAAHWSTALRLDLMKKAKAGGVRVVPH
jgi:hypothetical protein